MSLCTHAISRRRVLQQAATAGTLVAGSLAVGAVRRVEAAAEWTGFPVRSDGGLQPHDAITGILSAMERFPLVAITERHMLQEWHDAITAVLMHPALPGMINDIVVEFGNAAYQNVADRFVLDDRPVARADLEQIWRQIGDPTWNAPVYEQFFRTVRAVNGKQPRSRRIRILLGQPPVTMQQVLAQPTNRALMQQFSASTPMNAHFAEVVEREVLHKGRRALLIAGGGHILRGIRDDSDPRQLNAVSRLAQHHSGKLYVIDLLLLPPGQQQDPLAQRVLTAVEHWPRPALATLTGTWLGAITSASPPWINELADRATSKSAARYDAQADAVLYLGPGDMLTASQPDPAIYHWGAYPAQIQRVAALAGAGDQVAIGLGWAQAGPSWFSLWQ